MPKNPKYVKLTRAERRTIDAVRTAILMKKMSDDPDSRIGFVERNERNQRRDATKSKGLDYSKCRPVKFEPAPAPGAVGTVHMQNRQRQNGRIHRVPAFKVAWCVPKGLRQSMGLVG